MHTLRKKKLNAAIFHHQADFIVSDEVMKHRYTPVPLRFWLILHSSEARFISSGHLQKTIVSQSDEFDLCLLTIRSVSDVFGVV